MRYFLASLSTVSYLGRHLSSVVVLFLVLEESAKFFVVPGVHKRLLDEELRHGGNSFLSTRRSFRLTFVATSSLAVV
jgi:hypothetical protein